MSSHGQLFPVVFDIESEPDREWLDATEQDFVATLEPPSNYKNAEAIGRWMQEKLAARVERAALSPIDGRITAFAAAPLWREEKPVAMVSRTDEADLLRTLVRWVEQLGMSRPIIAGWHINGFDIPFISARAALHRVQLPEWWPDFPRRYGVTLDAAELLPEGRLQMWLKRFGLPLKTADGAEAPSMPDDQLLEYVRNDVHVERELLRRLANVSPAIRQTMPDPLP